MAPHAGGRAAIVTAAPGHAQPGGPEPPRAAARGHAPPPGVRDRGPRLSPLCRAAPDPGAVPEPQAVRRLRGALGRAAQPPPGTARHRLLTRGQSRHPPPARSVRDCPPTREADLEAGPLFGVENMGYRSFTAHDRARELFHRDLIDASRGRSARSDARRLNSKSLASSPWPSRAPAPFV
jgi:hypothetical protein